MMRIVVAVAAVFWAWGAPAMDVYISPGGDDANPGTAEHPLATLEAARDLLRASKDQDPCTVWLQDGRYERSATFELFEQDGGTAAAPVVYRAVHPGKARICGSVGLPSDAWKKVTEGKTVERIDAAARVQIRQMDLAAVGLTDYGEMLGRGFSQPVWPMEMELFAGDRRMTLARWPNYEEGGRYGKVRYGKVQEVGTRSRIGETDDRPGRFVFDHDRIERWVGVKDAWLHGVWAYDWADRRVRLLDVDPASRVITAEHSHYGFLDGRYFYAVNLLEELDSPGEYYIDRDRGILYFWPPEALDTTEARVSLLAEPLVAVEGASHVTFRDLVFEESRSLGIGMTGGAHNRIVNCTLRNLGTAAINIGEGERGREIYNIGYGGGMAGLYHKTDWNRNGGYDHGVVGCHIHDIAAYGIMLGGGDRKTLTPARNFVEDCHIHHIARVYEQMFSNINIDGVGNRVSHNHLTHNPHSVIMYWGNDHLIEYNEIDHCVYDSSDAGAIYDGRDPSSAGNVIRWNFFHHIKGHENYEGIFFDDGCSGQMVYGNVFHGIGSRGAVKYHGGQYNQVINNIIVDCSQPIDYQLWSPAKWEEFLQSELIQTRLLEAVSILEEPYRSRYPELAAIFEVPYSRESHVDERNLVTSADDPIFEDGESLDFRIRDWAAMRKRIPGFQVLPVGQIGTWSRDRAPRRPGFAVGGSRLFAGQTLTLRPAQADQRREGLVIRYTLDGSDPVAGSTLYTQPVALAQPGVIKARAFAGDGTMSAVGVRTCEEARGEIYLDELPMLESEAHNGVKVNRNYAFSNFVRLGTNEYQHSLMVCPTGSSRRGFMRFDTSIFAGRPMRFLADVGIDAAMQQGGSSAFLVRGRRGGTWETLYESPVLKARGLPVAVEADLTGYDRLELMATDGGDNPNADHAAWGNPRLVVE